MDSDSIYTLIVMIALLMMSGFFSAAETSFSTVNRSRLKTLSDRGNKKADLVLKMCESYDTLLSTTLVGNNIVNIALASIATLFFVKILGGNSGATVSTVVTTLAVLIFGEISPKSLSKDSPEKIAMAIAPLLRVFVILLTPINFLFVLWKKLLSKVFKVSDDRRVTEEELLTIVEEAEHEGGINEAESELIRSAIEFNDLEVGDIYTPRVDVSAITVEASDSDVSKLFMDTGYSRLPVYEESIDNIVGVIHQKDFVNFVENGNMPLKTIVKPVEFIPPTMKISHLLKVLQQTQSHMAIIVDEFGGTEGIVTMEDILEELVGEIWDEHDEIVEDVIQIDATHFRVMGNSDLEDLLDEFDLSCETDCSTVSGWVMEQLGRIPDEGDKFAYDNLEVVVSKIDNNRVVEVLIHVLPVDKSAD